MLAEYAVPMQCLSCEEFYGPGDAGTCKECYKEANETKEELKTEIDALKAKVAFLSLSSPIDKHNPSDTDVIFVPCDESSDLPSLTIPAHKVVLVSISLISCFTNLPIKLTFLHCCFDLTYGNPPWMR